MLKVGHGFLQKLMRSSRDSQRHQKVHKHQIGLNQWTDINMTLPSVTLSSGCKQVGSEYSTSHSYQSERPISFFWASPETSMCYQISSLRGMFYENQHEFSSLTEKLDSCNVPTGKPIKPNTRWWINANTELQAAFKFSRFLCCNLDHWRNPKEALDMMPKPIYLRGPDFSSSPFSSMYFAVNLFWTTQQH